MGSQSDSAARGRAHLQIELPAPPGAAVSARTMGASTPPVAASSYVNPSANDRCCPSRGSAVATDDYKHGSLGLGFGDRFGAFGGCLGSFEGRVLQREKRAGLQGKRATQARSHST
jgi:hypothetical protein